MNQALHGLHRVVDPGEQDRLASEGNAGGGQARAGALHLRRDLLGVSEVDAHPKGMVASQAPHQLRRDALRQDDRHLGPDADDLHVSDRPQAGQQPFELLVGQGQRVPAGKQYIPDPGSAGDVLQGLFPAGMDSALRPFAPDQAGAGAVPAVGRAEVRHQEQHPVGVAVHQARHGAVVVLPQWVFGLTGGPHVLVVHRDGRAPKGLGGIPGVEKAGVVRRDGQRQTAGPALDRRHFVHRQIQDPGKLLEAADAVAELPMPVVPLHAGDARIQTAPERLSEGTDRKCVLTASGSAD